ncbi:MAG TPA: hypothetical protein VEZ70_07745 [Allosphingosinicella sp.]|jgi:uncharacterized protein|nr:hypothetical protein [Allosphingosinicella sp.]
MMIRKPIFAMVSLASVLFAVTAPAAAAPAAAARPSFSCAKAMGGPERAICGDPELARLDRIMADLFLETRSLLLNANQTAEADAAQRAWLVRRNRCGSDIQCLRRAYFSRVTALASELPSDD